MDEHYIEFTAIIGPIGKPHKLHTFDVDGTVNSTVHGDLAERLANAVWEVDHDANISTHVTTEAEMQDVETWRKRSDGYRTKMDQIAAERDRLRAVVDAVQLVVTVARHIADEYDPDAAARAPTIAVPLGLVQALRGNLDQLDDQLDESADMGEDDKESARG